MVNMYPVVGKGKSFELCSALIVGMGTDSKAINAAVFYGVNDTNIDEWRRVLGAGRDYFYIDNSYFDATRGTHFRVTKNAIQHDGKGESDGKRFAQLGVTIQPWQKSANHIVVCPQSDSFMRDIAEYSGDWFADTVTKIRSQTGREIRSRGWSSDKIKLSKSLPEDLEGAHSLVTYSSAAAVTALFCGVPVFCESGAAACMSGDINNIEKLVFPEDRQRWAGVLADHQWTIEEMHDGSCWEMLSKA